MSIIIKWNINKPLLVVGGEIPTTLEVAKVRLEIANRYATPNESKIAFFFLIRPRPGSPHGVNIIQNHRVYHGPQDFFFIQFEFELSSGVHISCEYNSRWLLCLCQSSVSTITISMKLRRNGNSLRTFGTSSRIGR